MLRPLCLTRNGIDDERDPTDSHAKCGGPITTPISDVEGITFISPTQISKFLLSVFRLMCTSWFSQQSSPYSCLDSPATHLVFLILQVSTLEARMSSLDLDFSKYFKHGFIFCISIVTLVGSTTKVSFFNPALLKISYNRAHHDLDTGEHFC